MKILVKLDYSNGIVFPAEQAGVIASTFATGQHVSNVYGKGKYHWELTDTHMEMELIPDESLAPLPEPLAVLAKTAEDASDRWLQEYNKRVAVEKKVKELEDKLAALKTAVSEEPLQATRIILTD